MMFTIPHSMIVCCPCGSENCHMEYVEVNQGGHVHRVQSDGLYVTNDKPVGRGTAIAVRFWCESGHTFALGFRFHKGTTTLELASDMATVSEADKSELWRD